MYGEISMSPENEPTSYQCKNCLDWSQYTKQFPKKWANTDKGYFCEKCIKKLKMSIDWSQVETRKLL